MRPIKFRAWDGKYEIGSDGSVWSKDYNHTGERRSMLQYLDEDGYPHVFLNLKGKRSKLVVHRAVAKLFLGPRPTAKHQVNHKNGQRSDNRVENLEWVTSRENTLHGWRVNGRKQSKKAIDGARKRMVAMNKKRYAST